MEVVGPIRASSASVSKCDLAIPIDESPSVSLCLRESQEPSANTSFRAGGGAGFQGEVKPDCRVNLVDPKIAQSDQQRQAATQRFGKLLADKNGRPERSPLATSTGRPRVEFRPREALTEFRGRGAPQNAVVHVADIARRPDDFFNEAVEPSQVEVREMLRRQTADRQTAAR
jgi:hypothetical protein